MGNSKSETKIFNFFMFCLCISLFGESLIRLSSTESLFFGLGMRVFYFTGQIGFFLSFYMQLSL